MTAGSNPATPRAPLPFLGLACAVSVSSIYYNQPLLLEMGIPMGPRRADGVCCGLDPGRVCVRVADVRPAGGCGRAAWPDDEDVCCCGDQPAAGGGGSHAGLADCGSFVMGMLASVTHVVVPIAPDLVVDKERGRAIGMVMTGLLLGILLARTFAGWVSRIHGWRYVSWWRQ